MLNWGPLDGELCPGADYGKHERDGLVKPVIASPVSRHSKLFDFTYEFGLFGIVLKMSPLSSKLILTGLFGSKHP